MNKANALIMVVDDSLVVRKILETCLRRADYQVESFEDGVEALRSLQASERQRLPDLIILDVILPKIDGYEVVIQLKSRPELSRIAVVMLSRRDGILDQLKGRLAGANAYLIKPFRINEVIQVVCELLHTAPGVVESQ